MRKIIAGLLIFVFLISGCKKVKKNIPSQAKKKPPQKVESVELAKAILWPQPYQFKADDPFKPLIGKSHFLGEGAVNVKVDLKLLGVLNLDKSWFALIKTPSKVNIFTEGDKISGYTIARILPDKVILKKEGEELILKIRRRE